MRVLLRNIHALVFVLSLFWLVSADAAEQIEAFDVFIDVQQNADILVTETISVSVEGNQIRRGIFRDLPRYYEKNGARFSYAYKILSVTRDGKREPYAIEREGGAYRIRIGDADVFLERKIQQYEIAYRVRNQVRYFSEYDEIFWNATGTYWNFPIAKAQTTVRLPGGANGNAIAAYTGARGQTGRDYEYVLSGNDHVFKTTRALERREGLTVAIGFDKGIVDPPSAADKRAEWLARNATSMILSGAIALLIMFYGAAFNRVGRDPIKGPVFPRYEPPEGYSPAAVHHIFFRRLKGTQALIASFLNLAVNDRIKIDASEKKKTTLEHLKGSAHIGRPEEENLIRDIFDNRKSFVLGSKYDAKFTSAYGVFRSQLTRDFGEPYFKWNAGFLVLGIGLTVVALILAVSFSVGWTIWHTGAIGVLGALAVMFAYLLPAPTEKGQTIRTEIEGFRLYLKTAERLQLNTATPGSDQPPAMSVERYEKFLPYAVALGVEKPWTDHFEKLMPALAENYEPRWSRGFVSGHNSLAGVNKSMMTAMSSGVGRSLPQSSGSSGSGGGGSSGGGGGGGGGGGW